MSLIYTCDFCGKAYNVEEAVAGYSKYVYGNSPQQKIPLPSSPLRPCDECEQAKERAANEALDKIKQQKLK